MVMITERVISTRSLEGSNESPAWCDEPNKHHDNDDIPPSAVSGEPYEEACGASGFGAVGW
jgi:hypothetical protein